LPEEDDQDHQPPLYVELTGYRLLNATLILAIGIRKAISSYHGQSVIPTTLGWVSGTLLATVLYYVGLLQDKHPEICPYFFRVDWAPPILKFVRSSELYSFLLSLSPLQPAVALLQFTLTFREAKLMDIQSLPSAASSITIIMTIVYITLGILSVLQHLMKPEYRLRALHRFLSRDVVLGSFWVVLVVSQLSYLIMMQQFASTIPSRKNTDDSVLNYRYVVGNVLAMGYAMTITPMILLLRTEERQDGNVSLQLQLMEAHPKFLRRVGLLYIVPGVTVDIACVPLSVGALFMAHSQNYDHPYYALYPCYLVLFSLHHCFITLPTWLFLFRRCAEGSL